MSRRLGPYLSHIDAYVSFAWLLLHELSPCYSRPLPRTSSARLRAAFLRLQRGRRPAFTATYEHERPRITSATGGLMSTSWGGTRAADLPGVDEVCCLASPPRRELTRLVFSSIRRLRGLVRRVPKQASIRDAGRRCSLRSGRVADVCARPGARNLGSWDVSASPACPPREGRPCADLGAYGEFVFAPAHEHGTSLDLPMFPRWISRVDAVCRGRNAGAGEGR